MPRFAFMLKGFPTNSSRYVTSRFMTLNTKNRSRIIESLILIMILSVGFALRLADLDDPPLDFHGTRQLRSMILARGFYLRALPNADAETVALSAELTALESYEPPIMEHILASVYRLIGREDWRAGRVFSALFWTIGAVFVWLSARRLSGSAGAFGAILIPLFFPMSVIMSRSIQPDPWMCAWIMAAVWAALGWAESGSARAAVLTAFFGAAAILVKAFAAFFIAGLIAGVFFARVTKDSIGKTLVQCGAAGLGAVVPCLAYYLVFMSGRSGDFVSFWVASLGGMILDPGFYADWAAMLRGLITLPVVIAALLSLTLIPRSKAAPVAGLWFGYLAYGLTVPYQIATHEYYSLMIYPLAAVSIAPLIGLIRRDAGRQGCFRAAATAVIFGAASFYGGYVAVGKLRSTDYALEPPSWARAGAAIPADGRVIGLTGDYGMRLNYYGWRRLDENWPTAGDERLFQLAGRGAADMDALFDALTAETDYFFVSALGELAAQPGLADRLAACKILKEGNGFAIYDLREAVEESR